VGKRSGGRRAPGRGRGAITEHEGEAVIAGMDEVVTEGTGEAVTGREDERPTEGTPG
jgi:hypothetical protein